MKINWIARNGSYTEHGQRNPIRWATLKETAPSVFENTTKLFKCKDYFNDFVAHHHLGVVFNQYGMASNAATFTEDGGLYLMVANVTMYLEQNIENCINTEFIKTWGVHLKYWNVEDVQGDKTGIIYFPKEALSSTFRISLLSLCVRSCNINKKLKDFDELLDQSFMNEGGLGQREMTIIKQREYNFDEETEYVWYQSEKYNSVKIPLQKFEMVHNCGVISWLAGDVMREKFPYKDYKWNPEHSNLTPNDNDEEDEDTWEEECEE